MYRTMRLSAALLVGISAAMAIECGGASSASGAAPASLTEAWTATLAARGLAPTAQGGSVYVTTAQEGSNELAAFNERGGPACTSASPAVCPPRWSMSFPGSFLGTEFLSVPVVRKGIVYLTAGQVCSRISGGGGLQAYNATTGASVYQYESSPGSYEAYASTPDFFKGKVGTSGFYCDSTMPPPPPYELGVLDPSSGAPVFYAGPSTPAANGLSETGSTGSFFFAVGSGTLYAFDARGVTNCGAPPPSYRGFAGTPFCQPLWSSSVTGPLKTAPVAHDGHVYVGGSDGTLYVFSANGCGRSVASCGPVWTGSVGGSILNPPTVANGSVYVGSTAGTVSAFAEAGCGSTHCSPTWSATTSGAATRPSVAHGTLAIGSEGGDLYTFPASGCGQTTCSPSSVTPVGAAITSAPAVTTSWVFVSDSADLLHAYRMG